MKLTFEGWMRLVDIFLVDRIGLDSGSMEDWNWYDAYEAGHMPIHATEMFINDMFWSH